jgi:HemY protein
MVRLLVFLALLCLAVLGLTWFADHPGQVGLTWQGYRIETSLMMVAAAGVLVLAVLIALLWGILRFVFPSARP